MAAIGGAASKKDVFRLDVTGFDELVKTFSSFADINTSSIIHAALLRTAKRIEGTAKELLNEKVYNTPPSPTYVRTGLLRVRTVAPGKVTVKGNTIETDVKAKTEYAIYVELGTQDKDGKTIMKPRAFLLPAAQMNESKFREEMQRALFDYFKSKVTL